MIFHVKLNCAIITKKEIGANMGKIIAISNQKGGVGKTTTAINLAAALAKFGKRVMAIDFDPQGNLSSSFGIDKNNIQNTIYELIMGTLSMDKVIVKTKYKNLSLIPSNINLSGAEIELLNFAERETVLKEHIKDEKDKYDFIIIDCPPSLSLLTINALACADSVLIPLQCEYYALEGLSQMLKTISMIKEKINIKLSIQGIVFTMYDTRNNLSTQVVEDVKAVIKEKIYKTLIPRNVRLAEAPSFGMPIIEYDIKSLGAIKYMELAKEILKDKNR